MVFYILMYLMFSWQVTLTLTGQEILMTENPLLDMPLTLVRGVISWSSNKQPTVSLSSIEAEYKALTGATCEAIWLRRILEEVGTQQKQATRIQCDNQSSIKLAHNPVYHARSKHIELQHNFVREKIESQVIELIYCNTSQNVADVFTKPVGRIHFEDLRKKLSVFKNSFLH